MTFQFCDSEIRELQSLWQSCVFNRGLFTETFYTRFFKIDPDAEKLFTTDRITQGWKLIDTITFLINTLEKKDNPISEIIELGKRHKEYKVVDYQYPIVLEIFLWTFEKILNEKFTMNMKKTWIKFYNFTADIMIENS